MVVEMLIPFGMKDNKIFDVSEVERGRACNCICPSCKQRLIANKGDPEKKIHHFSHDPKSIKEGEPRKDCEYSFFVAARLLIKQRMESMGCIDIQLPIGFAQIVMQDVVGEIHTDNYYFAKSKIITLNQIEIEKSYLDSELDIVGYCGKHAIGIHFSYDGRPSIKSAINNRDEAILEIDLTELLEIYRELKLDEGMTFIDVILEYVLNSGDRSWANHPRMAPCQQDEQTKFSAYIEKYNRWLFRKDDDGNDIYEQYYGQGGHYCPRCKCAWLDEHSRPRCPECSGTGKPFGRRAEITSIQDLDKLRAENTCLKCFSCRANVLGEICSSCYLEYQNQGVYSVKEIVRGIVQGMVKESG